MKGITPPTEGDIKQAKEYAHGEENYTKLRSFATDFVLKEATLQTKNHDFIRTESVNNLTNSYINSDDTCKKAKQPKQIQTKQLGN